MAIKPPIQIVVETADYDESRRSWRMALFGPDGSPIGAGEPGAKGDKGDKGDPGDPGADGADGAPGPKGDKGDTGNTGAQGTPGAKGDKGDPGDPGPPGADGADGADGAPGADGADGAPGSTLLSGLEDVALTALADGDGLVYNATTEEWENGPIVAGEGGGGGTGRRVLTGVINADGTVARGTGFGVVHNGTGDYTVTFTDPFASAPVVEAEVAGAGANTVKLLNDTTTSTIRFIVFNTATGNSADLMIHFSATAPGDGGLAPGVAEEPIYDQAVTGVSSVSVDVSALHHDIYEIEFDGLLSQGGVARYVRVKPNNAIGTNPGNLIRSVQHTAYVGFDGTAGHNAFRIDEQGLVMGLLIDTRDAVIMASARFRAKTGVRRLFSSRMDSTSNDAAEVNQSASYTNTAKMADTATAIDSLVIDFGGGTFTGRITVK